MGAGGLLLRSGRGCVEPWALIASDHPLALDRCDIDQVQAADFSLDNFQERYSLQRPVLVRNVSANAAARHFLSDRCDVLDKYGAVTVDVGDPFSLSKHGDTTQQMLLDAYLARPFDAENPLYFFDREGRWTSAMQGFSALLVRPHFLRLSPSEAGGGEEEELSAFLERAGLVAWAESFERGGIATVSQLRGLDSVVLKHVCVKAGLALDEQTERAVLAAVRKASDSEPPIIFAIGKTGSGIGLHQHQDAWNQLLLGRKRWTVYPGDPGGVPPAATPEEQATATGELQAAASTGRLDVATLRRLLRAGAALG
eukprot:COSAG06_NODE_12911_length_1313_cov_1.076606_1_plen_311_part_10